MSKSIFVGSCIYYPTVLSRVQITPKTSTNISRYLYCRKPVLQVVEVRAIIASYAAKETGRAQENQFDLLSAFSQSHTAQLAPHAKVTTDCHAFTIIFEMNVFLVKSV